MAIDSDNSISLPKPPPPRPAARREAVEAALRRFDGREDPSASGKRPKSAWWASHQRQLGAFATAALIALVSVPVALTVLRDQPKPAPPSESAPAAGPALQTAPITAEPSAPQQQADQIVAAGPRSRLSLQPNEEAQPISLAEKDAKTAEQAPAAVAAAPPAPPAAPPPPPPPPPPASAQSEGYADEASAEEMVVTGSRIAQPNLQKPKALRVTERSSKSADSVAAVDAYGEFLKRLQTAVRANDRRAVVRLVDLPFRVNFDEGARTYRDRRSIERDYNRIFTLRVRRAILNQKAGGLFTNYQGAMIGDGKVWFDQTCTNASCSQVGSVRIRSVNP